MSTSLPSSMELNIGLGIVTCTEHGSSYTISNVDRHLAAYHHIDASNRCQLMEYMRLQGIRVNSAAVRRPEDGSTPIYGLPIHDGFKCIYDFNTEVTTATGCRYLSINKRAMKDHARETHGLRAPTDGDEAVAYRYETVRIQTLWTQKRAIDYFVVNTASQSESQPRRRTQKSLRQRLESVIQRSDTSIDTPEPLDPAQLLRDQYDAALASQHSQYEEVEPIEHVSELTNWLRSTGYQAHIEGLNTDEFEPAIALPDRDREPKLVILCDSISRVLRKAMKLLRYDCPTDRQISRLCTKLLNTFRRSEMSKDPIKPLQNKHSEDTYISLFQRFICFFARVGAATDYFSDRTMFTATDEQIHTWEVAYDLAEELNTMQQVEEAELEDVQARLDKAMVGFCMQLLQQRIGGKAFDSAVVSFAGIAAWDSMTGGWHQVTNHTAQLSRIIYCFQLVVIQHCLDLVDSEAEADFKSCMVRFRDEWLLNDTDGPMAELLSTRLLGKEITRETVETAQIRWHGDNNTLVYKDLQLSMDEIRELKDHQLATAKEILRRDLLFELGGIPAINIDDIVDNWDARKPGASFVTDPRNKATFGDADHWLFDAVTKETSLMELLLARNGNGSWSVRLKAARSYEDSVQQFLESLMVLVHIGSGQPARRPELVGLRWCNRQADLRNLFVHDGLIMFILSYHKSLSVTNASRYPVRVLLPEVGELLVAYLVLIQPFRGWMLQALDPPKQLSEYLWSYEDQLWIEDRLTRVFTSRSKLAIGKPIDIRSWRQIAVGIAIKKFQGEAGFVSISDDNNNNNNSSDDGDMELEVEAGAGSMPEAFHWQASHTPRTGNQAYGGTINFRNGLTDAGLQEYIRISRLWHRLLDTKPELGWKRKHGRQESDMGIGTLPLAKRLANKQSQPRFRRQWTMAEARVVLRDIYGPTAEYRSPKQEEAIRALISGQTPIIAVLATGEGKSLLYMLPVRLPGAGTTVLVVPLIALKQDTIRRCQAMGTDCLIWDHDSNRCEIGSSLVIVSIDVAVGTPFKTFLNRLDHAGRLHSIVFDEAHILLVASNYRQKLIGTRYLRQFSCQYVYLTATLPLCMMTKFMDEQLLGTTVTIRSNTVRRDIKYSVRHSKSMDLIGEASNRIKKELRSGWFTNNTSLRAIVYTRTKQQADELGEKLGCPVYYSDSGMEEEKEVILKGWIEGKTRVLAATRAFGAGIDYPHVRIVFHVGEPCSAIDFAQEVGRGGRDGSGSMSMVILEKNWRAKTRDMSGELLDADGTTMQGYLDKPRCRMMILSQFLDVETAYCSRKSRACDRCAELGMMTALPTTNTALASISDLQRSIEVRNREQVFGEERRDGRELLIQSEQGHEAEKLGFIRRLQYVRGGCVVCGIMGRSDWLRHGFDECLSTEKGEFFKSKKTVMRSGWMERYSGCFGCGLSQVICGRMETKVCQYKDVAMPVGWAVYRHDGWVKEVVDKEGRTWKDEREWVEWLGRRRGIFGEEGSNMMAVTIVVLSKLVKEV